MPQARHISRALPFADCIPVGAQGSVGLVARQRERDLVHTVGQGALGRKAGVGEHLQHQRVFAQSLRDKCAHPPAAGQ